MGHRVNLDSILVGQLAKVAAPGGQIFQVIKNTDPNFHGFGEAYFSWIESGVVKAWRKHKSMTMNLVCPIGKVQFVFYGGDNSFRLEEIGEDCYRRITVPPGVWFGFKGLSTGKNLILNIANIPHDSSETERLLKDKIDFNWGA